MRVACWFRRLAETIFRKVRDDGTSSPARETRALSRAQICRRILGSDQSPQSTLKHRKGQLRHRNRQSQLRILDANLAIAEDIPQIRDTGWPDYMGVLPPIANRRKTDA